MPLNVTQNNGHADGSDRMGAALQQRLDAVAQSVARRPLGAAALGAALAFGLIAGGLALFVVVWAVLVGLAA